MRNLVLVFVAILVMTGSSFAQSVGEQLQNVAVTIRAGQSEGSGVIITRVSEGQTLNFVLTAGHVIDGLRHTHIVGGKTVIEFRDAQVVKQLVENGRKVGEMALDAKVVKHSDVDHGHDVAVLLLRKRNFIDTSVKFYLDENIPTIGTDLYHCGSLLGTAGSNSLTSGIISNVGRLIDEKEYDQYDGGALPGSSGGLLALKSDGRYVGMLTRGASDVFTLFTPVRRLKSWANEEKLMWLFDEAVPVPTLKEIDEIKLETSPKENVLESSALPKDLPLDLQNGNNFRLYSKSTNDNKQEELTKLIFAIIKEANKKKVFVDLETVHYYAKTDGDGSATVEEVIESLDTLIERRHVDLKIKPREEIVDAATPSKAKRLGQKVTLRQKNVSNEKPIIIFVLAKPTDSIKTSCTCKEPNGSDTVCNCEKCECEVK